jgi:TolB protein
MAKNMKKHSYKIYYILSVLLVLFSIPTYAALDLELTQGVNQAIPIVITPFNAFTNISTIVNNDLKNSGRFRITTAVDQNYAYLASQKIDNLLTGTVVADGDKYNINFKLTNVYDKATILD